MSDENQPESGLESTGAAGLPTPVVTSENSSDSQPSKGTFDAESFRKQIVEVLTTELPKAVSSLKDRRFDNLDKSLSDVHQIKAYLDAAGGDVQRAAREIAVDRLIQSASPESSGRDNGQERQSRLQQKATDILSDAEIAPNDPLVTDWAAKTYASEADAVHALTRAVVKRGKQGRTVPGSAVIVEGGGQVSQPPGDVDELTNKLNRAIASGNTSAISKADAELTEAIAGR